MLFTYKATNANGKAMSGTAEAASEEALLEMLRKQDIHPVLVQVKKNKLGGKSLFGPKKKIKLGDLVIFTRQLSTMISAGVPLARSLTALQNDSASPYMRTVLASITKDVESGMSMGDSFAKFPRFGK